MRPHVAAIYAFARVADDIADEGSAAQADRLAKLQVWQDRIHRAAISRVTPAATADRDDLIALALGHSIRSLDLPLSLFDDLLSAFAQDTMTTRYASWADVFDYCRRSANPIGRLVLRIAGCRDEALDRSSDALCTALQLTNFWQDFGRDWRAGRLYVPRDEQRMNGADEDDLREAVSCNRPLTPAWAQTLARAVEVTRTKFEDGRAVCDGVGGRLCLELRITWLGGARILERVDRGRTALLSQRPTLGVADAPGILWKLVRWSPVRISGR
jgi:squalene synthase HpnC